MYCLSKYNFFFFFFFFFFLLLLSSSVRAADPPPPPPSAISHAMARDGSSGGVIRLVAIDKSGVERECILGDQLPFMP